MKLTTYKHLKFSILFITLFSLNNPLYSKFPSSSYFSDLFLTFLEKCTALITAPLNMAKNLDQLSNFYNRAQSWQHWWESQEKTYEKSVETPEKAAELLQSCFNNIQFFGASTSHYQIEGGYEDILDQHGKPADTVEKYNQEHGLRRPRISVDFWNNYKTIIPKIKQELNINMLRISISWSRVQPDKDYFNREAIDRYVDIVKTLRENDIEPLVTFHHYTNPVWFQELDGFEKKENIHCFVEFCTAMYKELAPYVQYYSTINGSESYAFKAYFAQELPPYEKNLQKTMEVQCNILEAHVQIYEAIKEEYREKCILSCDGTFKGKEPLIGIQKNVHPIDVAKKTWKEKLLLWLSTAVTYFGNKIQNQGFDGFFTTGIFSVKIPGACSVYHENKKAPQCIDWIGINCYANREMMGTKQIREVPEKLQSESGHYYACPWIIYRATQQVYDAVIAPIYATYEKLVPIIITENGLATRNEQQREWYFKQIAIALHLITKDGYPLIGYLPWTTVDCFEWRSGLTHTYGLINVEFAGEHFLSSKEYKPVLKNAKQGAKFYADFIKYILRLR